MTLPIGFLGFLRSLTANAARLIVVAVREQRKILYDSAFGIV
jgi:hypothetical protein